MSIGTSSRRHPAIILPLLIVIVLVLIAVTCGHDETDRLQALIPTIDPDLSRALLEEPDPVLAGIARDKGNLTVKRTRGQIEVTYSAARREHRESDRILLESALRRISHVLSSEYHGGYYNRNYSYHSDTSDSLWTDCDRLLEGRPVVARDTSLTPAEKIEILTAMIPQAATCNHPALIGQIYSDISDYYSEIDKNLQLEYLHRSIAEYQRSDYANMLCQLYGVIGTFHASAGRVDSALYYYDTGLRLAHERRFPYQAARIISFLSILYQEQGRLALAHRLQKEAIEVCRRYKGGEAEFRFVMMLVDFYTDLGCWDVASRLLQSAAVFDVSDPETVADFNSLRYHTTRARLLIRENKIDEAESQFSALLPRTRLMGRRNHYPVTLYWWSEDLLSHGLPGKAIPRIREGIDYCRKRNLPELKIRFYLLLAVAYYKQSDYSSATAALDDFERHAAKLPDIPTQARVAHDALRIRLAMANGLRSEAIDKATTAYARLRDFVRGGDASSHGYIWLNSCADLRAAIHEVLRNNPETGYGFEMCWQSLYAELGRWTRQQISKSDRATASGYQDGSTIIERCNTMADSALSRLAKTDGKHLVYVNLENETWLFTADSRGVRLDSIRTTTSELRRQVADAWAQMSRRPSVGVKTTPRPLVRSLFDLARLLLPPTDPDYRSETPGLRTVYITADDFLGMIPFEALNLATADEYVPLLQRYDVAYTRSLGTNDFPEVPIDGLVVSDPLLSPAIQRRLGLEHDLTGARREAETIRRQFPGFQSLTGASCSKVRLLSLWEDTEFLFISTHFLQDPDLSYLTLLPLASPPSVAELGKIALDVEDIRRADLSGCRLAVLSGCSTGAPYVSRFNFGPGFGDAFIDAGVGQVMQTFWDVEDEATGELISDFVTRWRNTGVSPLRALCETRRDRMEDAGKIRHPNDWASFSIKLRNF
jgi:CHAT domain-containing protein